MRNAEQVAVFFGESNTIIELTHDGVDRIGCIMVNNRSFFLLTNSVAAIFALFPEDTKNNKRSRKSGGQMHLDIQHRRNQVGTYKTIGFPVEK